MNKKTPLQKSMIDAECFGNKKPVFVLVHGGFHDKTCFLTKPDGNPGWAPWLARHGTVFVTDMPGNSNPTAIPFEEINGPRVVQEYCRFIESLDTPVILIVHSLSAAYGFKLLEELPGKISHLVAIEPSAYGNIQKPRHAERLNEHTYRVSRMTDTIVLDMHEYISPAPPFFERVTTKYTERFPTDPASLEKYRTYLKTLHPQLLYEWFNIDGSQLRIERFENLAQSRILVVTAPLDPFHAEVDSYLVHDLQMHNVPVEHWELDEMGISGNGHMMMLENNSDELIARIYEWVGGKS